MLETKAIIQLFCWENFTQNPQNDKEECNFVIKTLSLVRNFKFIGNIKVIMVQRNSIIKSFGIDF